MPHPSQFKRPAGKKGPRQVTGKRQPKITLRPAPARDPAAPIADKGKRRADAAAEEDEGVEEDEQPRYGFRESLRGEAKPLEGLRISVSGCSGQKEDLWALAMEYGAERHGGLQEDTTHLIAAGRDSAKYKVAIQRRIHVMKPSWLLAVKEAWTSGEDVDYLELELQHAMPILEGVKASLTGFPQGEYKNALKDILQQHGAQVISGLNSSITHLIVASPTAPHSPTPSSDKLLHARKNRARLHPDLAVVWEGWAREAIEYGAIRPERLQEWAWNETGKEPEMKLDWQVAVAPPRSRSTRLNPAASTSALPIPPPEFSQPKNDISHPTRPSLVPSDVPGASKARSTFKGYDASLLEAVAAGASTSAALAPAVPTARDPSNGIVLKKRRRAAPSAADAALDLSLPAASLAGDASQALLQTYTGGAGDASRFVDADISELPTFDEMHVSASRGLDDGIVDNQELAYQLVPGRVEMQLVPKSKSVIRALSSRRAGSFVEADKSGAEAKKTARRAGARGSVPPIDEATRDTAGVATGADDSAFFDAATQISPLRKEDRTPTESSEEGTIPPIFHGTKLALMELKGPNPKLIQGVIQSRGGEALIDASEEELATVDWIIVDHVEPPARFFASTDPRVVSICWLELCIFHDTLLDPADRLLERPLAYHCPVEGSRSLRVHFSGFGQEDDPAMHHIKRFMTVIGATFSVAFDRKSTHLVVCALDDDPALRPEDLDGLLNPKVAKAREWGTPICSLRDLRQRVLELAEEADEGKENRPGAAVKQDKGKMREITNELEDRTMPGPLSDCVMFFSSKLDADRQSLTSSVANLGGTVARQQSDAVTHLVHAGTKANEPSREFKQAKANGSFIVHPRWIEECYNAHARVSEGDFPHTFDARRGGQLFDAGVSISASPSANEAQPAFPAYATTPTRASSTVPAALRRSPSKSATSPAGSPKASLLPAKRETSAQQLEMELECENDEHQAASSTSLQRRESDVATEVADAADLGGFQDQRNESPTRQVVEQSSTSSPRSSAHLRDQLVEEDEQEPSSDPLAEIPPLRSESRPPVPATSDDLDAQKNVLKQQTSLLLAQLTETAPQAEKVGRMRSRTALTRKKSSSGTISLTTSKTATPANTDSNSTSARRIPGLAYPLDPSQATQDLESMHVVYDNPHEAAAREQIRQALAQRSGLDAADTQDVAQESPGPRTRRSARMSAGRR
ncbi:protein kinase activating protein dpb11 [Rhodotorula toruloides]